MNEINKKVFITGSSGGIGQAICEKFINKNYQLILTSSSEDKINLLREKYGSNNSYYKLDISNEDNILNCMADISSKHKDLSVIVNNFVDLFFKKKGITDPLLPITFPYLTTENCIFFLPL